ncbi:MAG TPA: isoprenylcysteine carboxylmethyltransferase family protein [bacterium]|nr:isoprenylcysteine carboxylmethyltransferase family protein [bacterium]
MSICRKRLIYWLVMTAASLAIGIALDVALQTTAFPIAVRFLGLVGIILAHFPLKRTGRLLSQEGGVEEWGCTTQLVTTDIYQCLRHPHHLGVGIFMISLGLLTGHLWTFLIITVVQWTWVFAFLLLVEEPELESKFGEAYRQYRDRVPMLLAHPRCLWWVFSSPVKSAAFRKEYQE